MPVDILIKNGKVIDGTGAPARIADVAISGNVIVDIGDLKQVEARKVIDAAGKVVAPGFIDIHSHNDFYVNRDNLPALFEPFVRQGITTCVTGNCGWGIAPITDENRELFINTLGSNSVSIDKPFEWSSMDEFLSYVDKKGPVINMAHLVPHGPLRIIVMGPRNTFAEAEDITKMKQLLRQGLEAGCFGFSSGLMYYPGVFSNTDEIKQLNAVCGEHGGRYSTHLRAQCTTFPNAVAEAIEIARHGGTGLQISHFHAKPFLGNKAGLFYHMVGIVESINQVVPLPTFPNGAVKKGLELVDRAAAEGLDFGMDLVPYIMANTTITAIFPPWSNIGGTRDLLKRLADNATWLEIKKDMQNVIPQWPPFGARAWSDNYSRALGFNIIRILSVQTDKNRWLQGMSVMEIAAKWHLDAWEAARRLVLEEDGQVTIRAGFPPRPWIEKFNSYMFAHPQMSVMCDAILPECGEVPQAAYGTFPRFLGHYVRELKLITLEEGIRKITSLPAARYGIKGRGQIKEGFFADIVMFDQDSIKDLSTIDKPCVSPSGISAVIINGKVVVEENKYDAGANAGRVLRKRP
jgi:N-acyl-D-amino-acid deacylase